MIISEKPWSDYTAADYTVEEWHAACLVHLHEGEPVAKRQCKLPVKTPTGTVNRNGVHAAAAALAGARGGVDIPSDQKSGVYKALRALYTKLDEEPPESLKQSSFESSGEEFISHYGRKGMRWGVRKAPPPHSSDSKAVRKHQGKPAHSLSNKQLKDLNARMDLEKKYNQMNPSRTRRGRAHVQEAVATATLAITLYNLVRSPAARELMNLGRRAVSSA